ncbi:LysR family transcriptional regulator [Hwanghaeella sp.]|uniref:LysR family transcriptional regulator n=1 Tax=Hwanghaeella sp. TaxID=2605943 RepID=UPI003CCB7E36
MSQIPPLSALRAFEAAARHLSFKNAADELSVTPSSVSHQIKMLEDLLGVRLFVRFNREVALTQDGTAYAEYVSAALGDLAHATSLISRRTQASDKRPSLVISGNAGFIDCWLSARLKNYIPLNPDLEIQMQYGESIADYRHKDADIAIHYSSIGAPSSDALAIYRAFEFPVCRVPEVAQKQSVMNLSDLRHATLLHEHDRVGWRRWLMAAGLENIDTDIGPVFQNTQTVFNRVKAGDGIALADELVAYDELMSGHLIKPLGIVRQSDWTVYLLVLRRDRALEHIDHFSDWLVTTLQEFGKTANELREPKPFSLIT